MTALTTTPKTFNVPDVHEMTQLVSFCQVLATAPFYQKMGPGGVMAIYLTAKEMGLPLMLCMNGGLYTFDGKVTMSSQLMKVMIVNHGGLADIVHLDDKKCLIRFTWKGKNQEYSYSIEEAVKAGYMSKPVWRNHTKDMLYARALSGGARKYMPEVIMGAYVVGELDNDERDIETMTHTVNIYAGSDGSEPIHTHRVNESIHFSPVPHRDEPSNDHQEEKPLPGYQDFCLLHNIIEGTDIHDYIKSVANICERSQISVINSAIKNPHRFNTGFERWLADLPRDKKSEDTDENIPA